MRRFAMAAVLTIGTVLGVLAPVTGSTAAWADGPQHEKSTVTLEPFTAQPGEVCDFTYHLEGTASVNAVIFPDGREIDQVTLHLTHTNLDTGFALTENDYFSAQFTAGQEKDVGIFWHLRTADGKLVVVHAGQVVFSGDAVVRFTPNSGPDFAAVICPALGGSPA
jgi:hypothetical protein